MSDTPRLEAPAGACDCHMHVYDRRYPPAPTSLFPPPDAPASAYRAVQRALGLSRAVVVQPNAYAFDNACSEEAIAALGAGTRGIATVRPDVAGAEIERLTRAGFRGARCYMLKGGLLSWDDVEAIASRVAPFGWHVQIQLDGRELPLYVKRIAALATEAVIDHNGKFLEPVPTTHPAFRALVGLLDLGRCWVKLSAPYETSKSGPPRYDDVSAIARALVEAHPERCLWATNWPHPNIRPSPSTAAMFDLMLDWVPDEATRRRILVDNAARLYGF
ncbi:MAG TPA: amidohydrolase family protein [Casimicrobiaceae bacterium]|nr:amidohydrolase family protein [Casimicrobiaceae bacterium]